MTLVHRKYYRIVLDANDKQIQFEELFNDFDPRNLLKCPCLSIENYINVILFEFGLENS